MAAILLAEGGAVGSPVESNALRRVFAGEEAVRERIVMRQRMDLAFADGFSFEMRISSPSVYQKLTVYAVTGGGPEGCYAMSVTPPQTTEWTRVVVPKTLTYNMENKVAGWGSVEKLEICPKRQANGSVTVEVRNLCPWREPGPRVAVLTMDHDYEITPGGRLADSPFPTAVQLVQGISEVGVDAYLLSSLDLANRGIPDDTVLLVVPGLATWSDPKGLRPKLETFVLKGGKVALLGRGDRFRTFAELGNVYEGSVPNLSGVDLTGRSQESVRSIAAFIRAHVPALTAILDESIARRAEKTKAADAWAAAQPGARNETRIMDCHSPYGSKGAWKDWKTATRELAAAGYTHLEVNFCRGTFASYDSNALPCRFSASESGYDALADCLAECRKNGLGLIAWRVCFHMAQWYGRDADAVINRLRQDGRICADRNGSTDRPVLCPTHPENVRQEVESVVELAQRGVDGVCLDYIRYDNLRFCFCSSCKRLFEERYAISDGNWPDRLEKDRELKAKWTDFRADNISSIVSNVALCVRQSAPNVRIHVAGYPDPESARVEVGQDWPYWGRKGWIDVVEVMDYRDTATEMTRLIERQLGYDIGSAKLCVIYGPSCWPNEGDDSRKAAEQLAAIRSCGIKMFNCFELDLRTERICPVLSKGPMARVHDRSFD